MYKESAFTAMTMDEMMAVDGGRRRRRRRRSSRTNVVHRPIKYDMSSKTKKEMRNYGIGVGISTAIGAATGGPGGAVTGFVGGVYGGSLHAGVTSNLD